MMDIKKVEVRDKLLLESLYKIWDSSVLATHSFLNESDYQKISLIIPKALIQVPTLLVGYEDNVIVGFIGIDHNMIEMLFVTPVFFNKGVATKLMQYVIHNYNVDKVSVNEQNIRALAFYQKRGFKVIKRDEKDGMGMNYPILTMKKG